MLAPRSFQTGYNGITTLDRGLPYAGGFCRWYYTPRENITFFPSINPSNQILNAEPSVTKPWFGAVKVPNRQLGLIEELTRDARGVFYKTKVSGFLPGDSIAERINQENMAYHEFVVVGKMRAGGMYLIIGDDLNALQYDNKYTSAGGSSAGTEISLAYNALSKALILPSFNEFNTTPPPGYTNPPAPTPETVSDMEIINYTTETTKDIAWDSTMIGRFGLFPLIEVWYTEPDTGKLQLSAAPIINVNLAPPATTLFTVTLNAPGPGFIVIK